MAAGTAVTDRRPRFVSGPGRGYALAMRTLALALAAALLSPLAASQEIYRWVDENGVVHYSDQPGPGAERITIAGQIARTPSESESPTLYQEGEPTAEEAPPYQSLAITRPAADEVFFGTDATVAVEMALDADLRPGDSVVVFLDGERVPASDLSATLTNVPRGSHFLRAAVLDPNGSALVTSPQITFHVRQESIATPPVGPNLRPKPPPKPTPKPTAKPPG